MTETLRAPREEDAGDVAQLMSKSWPEPVHAARVRRDWSFPGVNVETDARMGPDSYALVESLDDKRVWLGFAGTPTAELLDWAELRAAAMGARLFSGGWATQEALLRELQQRGFRLTRISHRMTIDLSEPTPDPVWPGGFDARTFQPGDEQTFYNLHQETFKDSWEPIEETYGEWAHQFLTPDALAPALWTLACGDGEPAGFAICHPHTGDTDLGWVHVLGVRRPCRGRGLGRALLLRAFAQFRDLGMRRAGLGVDSASPTGAEKLYAAVGMQVSARFEIVEKSAA